MRSLAGLGISLLAISCVCARAFAEPPTPAPASLPPAAAAAAPAPEPTPPPQRKPWKEWLDRESALPREPQLETERVWYGWQNLLIDGLALTAVALTAAEVNEGVWVGIGLLALGSPIVHFAHLNVSEGFISLAIRVGSGAVVAAGAAVAVDNSLFDGDRDSETQGTVIVIVGLLGLASAVVIDAAHFGFEERPVRGRDRASITPWFDPEHGRIGLGYAGSF